MFYVGVFIVLALVLFVIIKTSFYFNIIYHTYKCLQFSQFPAISFEEIMSIQKDILFWDGWSRKARRLAKRIIKFKKKEDYQTLDTGCGEMSYYYTKLKYKAMQANAAVLAGKSPKKEEKKYETYRIKLYEEIIHPLEEKLTKISSDLKYEIIGRIESKIVAAGYDL